MTVISMQKIPMCGSYRSALTIENMQIGGFVREFSGLSMTLCYCCHGSPVQACRRPGVYWG
jgi:hypothetical protein